MAASGETNNLKLPIYVEGNETTSWADYNESMQKIDIFAGENAGKTDTNTDAIQTINDQLQTIVTEQNNNNETTQRLDSRVQAIDRNIVTINGTLSSHNQRIAALESEEGEIGSLVTTVTEHTNEIGQLKTDSASQNTQIQKNKTDIEGINTEITEISGDVASTNQNINQLTNRITTIENNANRMFNAKTIRGSYHLFGNIYHSDGTDNNISGNVSIVMNGSYIGSASNYNSDTPIKLTFAQIFDSSVISHSTTYIGANFIYTDNRGSLCTAGFSSIVIQNHGEAIWLYPLESITVNTGLITLEIHSSNSAT